MLPVREGQIQFPRYVACPDDPFIQRINASGKKWVIIIDGKGEPRLVLNANAFLRNVLSTGVALDPGVFAHRPVLIRDDKTLLGRALSKLKVKPERDADDVIDEDLILLWGPRKRIITGADILGRLLRGIAARERD